MKIAIYFERHDFSKFYYFEIFGIILKPKWQNWGWGALGGLGLRDRAIVWWHATEALEYHCVVSHKGVIVLFFWVPNRPKRLCVFR